MTKKDFKSRLFLKTILSTDKNYWQYLYAETLYRLKQLEDLNCRCTGCYVDRLKFKGLINDLHSAGHIPENPKPTNFTGFGDCGRSKFKYS